MKLLKIHYLIKNVKIGIEKEDIVFFNVEVINNKREVFEWEMFLIFLTIFGE